MVSWGIVMTMQGIVQNYHSLIVTRTLLGLTESGFFPAATFLLTTWYCRFEVQTRLSVFFSAASMAGAFSGLLAFAIEKMAGVGGLNGWRQVIFCIHRSDMLTGDLGGSSSSKELSLFLLASHYLGLCLTRQPLPLSCSLKRRSSSDCDSRKTPGHLQAELVQLKVST